MTKLQAPVGALLQDRLKALTPARLKGMRRGIEKESLRAQPNGALALTPHPAALGSALTHPGITTDFSESQVELVTSVHLSEEAALAELTQLHQFTLRTMKDIGDDMLWASSMPCDLPTDETIPIARFGSSNVGRAKSVYRMGLSHRYGRPPRFPRPRSEAAQRLWESQASTRPLLPRRSAIRSPNPPRSTSKRKPPTA